MAAISGAWLHALQGEFKKEYYKKLFDKVKEEYRTRTIFPPADDIFNAFHYASLEKVKVVILGQDPYHGAHQAHGLCFSVQEGVEKPPSLVNMMKELNSDLGCEIPESGSLIPWAKQGVMLLNTVLTVREGQPNSHKDIGWTEFTDRVIYFLNSRLDPVIFLLWGANAKEKLKLINNPRHYVLMAPHPSPLSAHRGFFGSKHYSKVNTILERIGSEPIDWNLR